MSRMADPEEWWGPKEDRKETVKRKLAEVGISLDGGSVLPGAETPAKSFADRNAELAVRDGFFTPEGGDRPISPTLAAMVNYRPPLHKTDQQIDGENEVTGELESLEAMRHG